MRNQQYNLENDIKNSQLISDKIRNDECYAQNIYAALCNNEFLHADQTDIMPDEYWACSWRYAGGIVAEIRGEGNYLNWYCSGMSGNELTSTGENGIIRKYRPESYISDEIRLDFKSIGWSVK